MRIATILFTYNRSNHTEQVLNSLKNNTVLPEKLIIFQDGLKQKDDKNIKEWNKVNTLLHAVDWCEKEIIVSEQNKGLARSIVSGINYAFEQYDAVIVLEDDCVTTSGFISFMEQCFGKYENDKSIYSVSGYSWPITIERKQYDIYGCGRISTWGWGTWKDRWEKYHVDNDIIKRLKQDECKSRDLAMWGNDLEKMLSDRIAGENDSWAVYWGLKVIEDKGICINPYKSLIQNIGMDGTGVHSGVTNRFETELHNGKENDFHLPDHLEILHTTEYAFADLYGNYTAASVKDALKQNVVVYGLGIFFKTFEKKMNHDFNILAFVDKKKKDWYAGKKVIKPEDLKQYNYDKIIIMVQSIQECIKIAKNMIGNGIEHKSIVLGHSIYGKYSEVADEINLTCDGEILLKFNDDSIKVESQDEFYNVCEVFVDQEYQYFINNLKRDIVIDVGMNIGDSSIYFAQQKNVDKVYGYEPFRETFIRAENNLRKYIDASKVYVFQYGISNENAIRLIGFNNDMTCGQSTLETVREHAYCRYKKCGLIQEINEQSEQIEVRKASEVFAPIFKEYPYHNIILKMDCEGEEYGIIEELLEKRILSCISFLMLEWHYNGKDSILSWLELSGFSYWCNGKSEDMGLIYAFNMKR